MRFLACLIIFLAIACNGFLLFAESTEEPGEILSNDALWNSIKTWEYEKGDCSITFHDQINGQWIGAISWCQGSVEFHGSIDESAKKFFDHVWKSMIYPDWEKYKQCKETSK